MVNVKLIVRLTRKILPHILDTSNVMWSKTHIFIILLYFELTFNLVWKNREFSQMRLDGCPSILQISIGV
jgi:hypothetical protein